MKKITALIISVLLAATMVYAETPEPENTPPGISLPEEAAENPDLPSDETDTSDTEADGELPPSDDGENVPSDEEDGDENIPTDEEDELPPSEDDTEEPLPEDSEELPPQPDFSDDMESSLKMLSASGNVIFETIPENQYGEFYEDYTIAQRTVKSEENIVYELPYWTRAEITAYFYQNEEINHFIISASADNLEYTEIVIEPEIISEAGKWHKVVYSFDKTDISQRYIKISWQDLEETSFTNWGQALGDIKVYNEAPFVAGIRCLSDERFAIPDSGEAEYILKAEVCDQMGVSVPEAVIAWQDFSDEVATLTADGVLRVTATDTDNIEYSFTAYVPETEVSLTVTVILMHYPTGDINSDFKITGQDLTLAGKKFMRPPEDDGEKRGDSNKDGKIGIYDLAYIAYNMEELPE